jgi:uncharacterized membrane protein (Fun14 family)
MVDVVTPIIFQLAIGGIGGFFIGYLVKKVIRLALIMGVLIFAILYLAYDNLIRIEYDQFLRRVQYIVTPAWGFLSPLLSNVPFVSSLIVGVIIGFKRGE